jgi:hypothetical protein
MEARGGHGKPFVSNNPPFCFLGATETRRKTKAKAKPESTEMAEVTEAPGWRNVGVSSGAAPTGKSSWFAKILPNRSHYDADP